MPKEQHNTVQTSEVATSSALSNVGSRYSVSCYVCGLKNWEKQQKPQPG
jgi:hypothetical protein